MVIIFMMRAVSVPKLMAWVRPDSHALSVPPLPALRFPLFIYIFEVISFLFFPLFSLSLFSSFVLVQGFVAFRFLLVLNASA